MPTSSSKNWLAMWSKCLNSSLHIRGSSKATCRSEVSQWNLTELTSEFNNATMTPNGQYKGGGQTLGARACWYLTNFCEKKEMWNVIIINPVHLLLHAPVHAYISISPHQSVESPLLEAHFIRVAGEKARHVWGRGGASCRLHIQHTRDPPQQINCREAWKGGLVLNSKKLGTHAGRPEIIFIRAHLTSELLRNLWAPWGR